MLHPKKAPKLKRKEATPPKKNPETPHKQTTTNDKAQLEAKEINKAIMASNDCMDCYYWDYNRQTIIPLSNRTHVHLECFLKGSSRWHKFEIPMKLYRKHGLCIRQ